PCGYYGSTKPCSCLPHEIHKYQRKLSGPIIDRIDLYIEVDEIRHETLLHANQEESSATIRKRVVSARKRQQNRYESTLLQNASLSNRDIKKFVNLSQAAEELLNRAAKQLSISARSYLRLIKVAKTIADLDHTEIVEVSHIGEALQYRQQTEQAI